MSRLPRVATIPIGAVNRRSGDRVLGGDDHGAAHAPPSNAVYLTARGEGSASDQLDALRVGARSRSIRPLGTCGASEYQRRITDALSFDLQ